MMKERFLEIVEKGKVMEIIPFLKSLTCDERKQLSPLVKKKIKECMQVSTNPKHGTFVGSHVEFNILSITSFVCFDYNDYKRNQIQVSYLEPGFIRFHEYTQQDLMKKLKIDDILEWYHPEWMSDYLNNSRTNPNFEVANYDELIRWAEKGYIILSPELVVATLQRIIFKHIYKEKGGGSYHLFQPERLLEYPVTLKEHIWYFFEYPSNIHFDMYWGLPNEDDNWMKVFKIFVLDGKLDRIRLLKECLLTGNRNFNKLQIGWFVDLFNELAPSEDELLTIQSELFTSLSSPQTKAVNNALNHIKTICTDRKFRTEDFIGYLPALLSSSTKSIIKTTVDIADKILKERKIYGNDISDALRLLVYKDDVLQKKATKLITTYGTTTASSETENITNTSIPGVNIPQSVSYEYLPHINKENSITEPETFEDFLFFAAQVFDNNEPWHCFLFVSSLLKFEKDITEDIISQLEPVFKSAAKVIDNWAVQIGLLDRTFAAFFNSYGRYLIKKFPGASGYLTQIIDKKDSLELVNWQNRIGRTELYPYYYILLNVLDSIKKGAYFQLLSTPTHSPLWIAPDILVKRLIICQQNDFTPYSLDLQLALQRCSLENTHEAFHLAKEELKGEIRDLIVYFFGKENEIEIPSHTGYPGCWMTATITKHPHTVPALKETWGFGRIPVEHITGNYKWSFKKNQYNETVLFMNLPVYNKDTENTGLFTEYNYGRLRSKMLWAGDIKRMMCSTPYNHDIITGEILFSIGSFSTMDSNDKMSFLNVLSSLYELRIPFSEMDYLFLSVSLLAPDKTIRDYAAELWVTFCLSHNLDSSKLGKAIGEVEQEGWLPVKRLTDLIENNMMNVSQQHNQLLEQFIAGMLLQLKTPITNLKKLLEIYTELLVLNHSTVTAEVCNYLKTWESVGSVKKIIKEIIKKNNTQ